MNEPGREHLLMMEPDELAPDEEERQEHLEARARKRSAAALANEASQALCSGCLDRPDRECAACGAPASVWTDAGDGRHAVAWCEACHMMLLSGRPAAAAALVYLHLPESAL